MKKIFIVFTLFVAGCFNKSNLPTYIYSNFHKFDDKLSKDDACFVIDNSKTTYKKGHKNLSISPFLGGESFNVTSVEKETRPYYEEFENNSCENPITLKREIEVSSIAFPDFCDGIAYAGSVYTGGTTTYNSWGTATTSIGSVPMYNKTSSPCIRTLYFTSIDFYDGKTIVGNVESEGWDNYEDIDYTIKCLTKGFIKQANDDFDNNDSENTDKSDKYRTYKLLRCRQKTGV